MSEAIYFDSRAALAASSELNIGSRRYRTPLLSPEELEAYRREAIREGCLYVKGRCGSTVFNFGFAGQPFKSWDGFCGE
jgi:hypothetical protein